METLYLKAEPEKISEYVLFSGDPFRVERVRQYLDDPFQVAYSREFNTWTGYYHGMKLTVTSTGIGAPGAAIAMEEMYEAGMKAAVRMGTVMTLKEEQLGSFLIPVAAMRKDGCSSTYVEPAYPAAADLELLECMNQAAAMAGSTYENGIICSMDGFYSQMHESKFSAEIGKNMAAVFGSYKKLGISGIDMESSCMLTLGRLMGVKTCVVTMATVTENTKKQLTGQERSDAEDLLCRVALDGLLQYHHHQVGKGN